MIRLGSHPEWHAVFETLGYGCGYWVYKLARGRAGDVIGEPERWSVMAGAVVGGLVGSRALGLLEQAPRVGIDWGHVLLPGGGKTIVGGLLGGWVGVEVVKAMRGIRSRTGDLFAVPLCVGIAVGRVGCLIAGLADDTYGKVTGVPWAVDFGDGVGRHPTQAYEILFLILLGTVLHAWGRREHREGDLFRGFMVGYLGWRVGVDFLKPQPLVGGMDWIQWACLAGLAWLATEWVLRRQEQRRAYA